MTSPLQPATPQVAELLLRHGAQPDTDQGAPLIKACQAGSLPCVNLLLSHGALPSARQGQCVLVALEHGDPELLGALLKPLPQVLHTGLLGRWALLQALGCRQLLCAAVLVQAGARLYLPPGMGLRMWQRVLGIVLGDTELLELTLRQAALSRSQAGGWGGLMC